MSYIDTKIISLTSQTATVKNNSTFLSDVRYEFGHILNDDHSIIHKQIQLLHAQIPYSFYVINNTNNRFRYRIGASINGTVTITNGNYTANSLIAALRAIILSTSAVDVVITISSITGKLTFTPPGGQNFIVFNTTSAIPNSIGTILGADPETSPSGTPLTLTRPLNLLGIKNLQIRSDNLNMQNISSLGGGASTLLCTIPVNSVPFGMIDYSDSGKNLISITNDHLDDIDLQIVDGESGALIDFNNQDWCITLALHVTKLINPIPKPTFKSIRQGVEPPYEPPPTTPLEANPPPLEAKPLEQNKDLEELNLLNN